ncbi:MAG: hypothetical protein EB060_08945 [Proteobacteria bacterium]|nr:hypothetical protein [Pseudomonadota bacterium]
MPRIEATRDDVQVTPVNFYTSANEGCNHLLVVRFKDETGALDATFKKVCATFRRAPAAEQMTGAKHG